jgi:hypothetical protein
LSSNYGFHENFNFSLWGFHIALIQSLSSRKRTSRRLGAKRVLVTRSEGSIPSVGSSNKQKNIICYVFKFDKEKRFVRLVGTGYQDLLCYDANRITNHHSREKSPQGGFSFVEIY